MNRVLGRRGARSAVRGSAARHEAPGNLCDARMPQESWLRDGPREQTRQLPSRDTLVDARHARAMDHDQVLLRWTETLSGLDSERVKSAREEVAGWEFPDVSAALLVGSVDAY